MVTRCGIRRYLTVCLQFGVVVAAATATSACDSLLEVELPDRLLADRLDDPSLVPVQLTGMMSDFECAFQGHALTGSVLAKEYQHVSSGRVEIVWVNRLTVINDESHAIGCTNIGGVFLPLQTARYQAEQLYQRVEGFAEVDNRVEVLGTTAAYAGYATTLLGEAFCEMALDNGPLMTRAQVFQRAEEWFTQALAHATSPEIRNLALVGRARTRLNLGNGAGALADAEQVTEGFRRLITTSTAAGRRNNRMFVYTHQSWVLSVAPLYRDLEVDGVSDPRVPATLAPHLGNDGVSPQWQQQKYASITAPLVLAGWREAQLIIAEVQGGQAAVDAINRLRVSIGLPLFASTDEQEIRAQVLEERRRELFLEGHRHGDMLRLGIPFPAGSTHKGEPFGPVTCIPLPNMERAMNPNFD